MDEQRAEPKWKNVTFELCRIAGVSRQSRDTSFAARVRSFEKGTLSKSGNSESTGVREGSAAAETEASLAIGEDTLERRLGRLGDVTRGVAEWFTVG